MDKKILIIEDDLNLLENIRQFLKEEGFIIRTEVDGQNGIFTAKNWLPDLILCDINIPVKDGYEVLKELTDNDITKTIPFIFLTAKVEKRDFRKGMQLGADDYIFKPFDIEDLLKSIKLRINKSILRIAEKSGFDLSKKIRISIGKKTHLELLKDLKYIKSENPYIRLKFADGKSTLKRETIDSWENKLPANVFIRIHRTTIVNTGFISKIERLSQTSYQTHLINETEPFIISKRYRSKMKDRFL
jgi:DNA-binding LytR/AlgR family response regulator